jgi:hypothetical protein
MGSMITIVSKPIAPADAKALFLANDLKPLEPFKNTMTAWKSECLRCHNIVSPKYNKVRIRGHQCAYCAGKVTTQEEAFSVVRKIGHMPLEPYKNALSPWKMKCGGCGKTISPKYNSLQQGKWSCGYCGHSRAGFIRRELSSPKAILQMRAAGSEPLVDYPGSHMPWKCMCLSCGTVSKPRLSGVLAGQGACIKCGQVSGAKKRMLTEEHAIKLALAKSLSPLQSYPGTSRQWKCKCLRCGQIVSPRLNTLQLSVYGCIYCAGKVIRPEVAELKMRNSQLRPLVPYPGNSGAPWLSECLKCHREVSPSYDGISAGQGGCIWCAGLRVDPIHAIAVMKSKGLQPLEPFKTASAKWRCRCLRCLKEVSPSYKAVSSAAGGCKFCSPNYVNLSKISQVVAEAGFKPVDKYRNASSKWKVVHKTCGRTIYITYDSIRSGHGCKYCAGVFTDEAEALQIMESAGFKPLQPYPGAKQGWRSKCLTCNHIVAPHLSSVRNSGGCIYCTGHKVDTSDAVRLMKANKLKPLELFEAASKPWKCECLKCHRTITPTYSSVRGGQGGCRFCADWGIDYAAPGFIYLMTNLELSAHKVGIGSAKRTRMRDRIRQHESRGWTLYKKLDFPTANEAFIIEQAVLSWLRSEMKLPASLSLREMPQGGYSETVQAGEIDLRTIWSKIIHLSKLRTG